MRQSQVDCLNGIANLCAFFYVSFKLLSVKKNFVGALLAYLSCHFLVVVRIVYLFLQLLTIFELKAVSISAFKIVQIYGAAGNLILLFAIFFSAFQIAFS